MLTVAPAVEEIVLPRPVTVSHSGYGHDFTDQIVRGHVRCGVVAPPEPCSSGGSQSLARSEQIRRKAHGRQR